MRRLVALLALALVAPTLLGCGGGITEIRRTAREVDRTVDAAGDAAREARQTTREVRRTGKELRMMRKKTFELQLFHTVPDSTLLVRFQPGGENKKSFPLIGPSQSTTLEAEVSRWVERRSFSILASFYRIKNGRKKYKGTYPIKVSREYRRDVQGGTEVMVLTLVDGEFKILPPQEAPRPSRVLFEP